MAHRLRWWILAPLGACGIVALAYLPPRSLPVLSQRYFRVFQTFDPPTPYRRRVQQLADRYRNTSFELAMREYRERLRPEFERRRALEIPGPALYFAGPDSLSDSARGLVRAMLDTASSQLGLGVTKISVGVVLSVEFDRPSANPGTPEHRLWSAAYLLPDSTDRTTCLTFLPITYWGRLGPLRSASPAPDPLLAEQLRNGLGTCAYYARFGTPGHAVDQWLGSRAFDLVQYPWGLALPADSAWPPLQLDRNQPWFWAFVYRFPSTGVACIAGRRLACRAAVLAKGVGDPGSAIVSAERAWLHPPAPAGAERYFADLVDHLGPERFGRLWNSELPVDTALAAALREPVGEWTRRWQATLVPPIRLGPVAPPSAIVLAALFGVAAVVLVMLTATRRQVR